MTEPLDCIDDYGDDECRVNRHPDRFATHALHRAVACSRKELASAVGVTDRTLQRWDRDGLDEWQADRAAIAVGLHPALVWPSWLPFEPGT